MRRHFRGKREHSGARKTGGGRAGALGMVGSIGRQRFGDDLFAVGQEQLQKLGMRVKRHLAKTFVCHYAPPPTPNLEPKLPEQHLSRQEPRTLYFLPVAVVIPTCNVMPPAVQCSRHCVQTSRSSAARCS
jgi:hypothetical protein